MNELIVVMITNAQAKIDSHFAALACFSNSESMLPEVAINNTRVRVSFGSHDARVRAQNSL